MSFPQPFPGCVAFILALSVLPLCAAIDFNEEVQPILSDRCFLCHGPDPKERKADLRLDVRDAALQETSSGRSAIAPGDADGSEIIRRIFSGDADEAMPPPKANLGLSQAEKAILRRWVEEGAPYEAHWSFAPPAQPPLPDNEGRSAIDRFIVDTQRPRDLRKTPEASRERLIRRLTFDLTGLPPTKEKVESFLRDPSPQAYEKRVDALLHRASFGERMAAEWMDVARYADSYGYQVDRDRFVWPWRDWVIKAFNENLPLDKFITWQLAGDLLPEATDEQVLATTFNRLHSQKVEGGSVPEEFRIEYVADRTHTFGTAFLGLTLECARCHDHKYDPISQKEYYQLSAFFANIDEAGLYSYFTESIPTPTLLLMDDGRKAELRKLEALVAGAESDLAALVESSRPSFEEWLRRRPSEPVLADQLGHFPFDAFEGNQLANLADARTPASSHNNRLVEGREGSAIELTGDDPVQFKLGNFPRFTPFSIGLWMKTPEVKERAVVFHRSRAWTDAGSRGYELLIEDGKLSASLIHFWPGNAIGVKTLDTLPVGAWQHVMVTYDGSSKAAGLRIYLNGVPARTETVRDHLYKQITGGGGDEITIGERFRDRGFTGGVVDEFRVFARELAPIEVSHIHDGRTLNRFLTTSLDEMRNDEAEVLFPYYLSTSVDAYRQQLEALRQARESLCKAVDGTQEIMVMRERPVPQITHVLNRGAYDAREEAVEAATPGFLPPMPAKSPANRLDLARWLTHPEHPLTARVLVNRYWQLFFGQGLARTPEDFGKQGARPTHPELLDWLARSLIDNGWDLKRFVRQLVLSETYRQDSRVDPEARALDPENLWLARAPRYRLPAEMIRDQALAVSGLLAREVGGPSVKPYEVAVSFKPVEAGKGEDLYRRSLYTYWKRTAPAPVMIALDAARREVCVARRDTTATPLQAFVFMNDPQMVEAARGLAERLCEVHGDALEPMVREAFVRLTSRVPTNDECAILEQLVQDQRAHFAVQPEAAKAFLQTGERATSAEIDPVRLAATTVLVTALFSYDECVVRR